MSDRNSYGDSGPRRDDPQSHGPGAALVPVRSPRGVHAVTRQVEHGRPRLRDAAMTTAGAREAGGAGIVRRAAGHPAAAPLGALAAALAGSLVLYGTDPHQPGHWLPRCPFNWATGLLCPVCGATRMAYDLLHADPVRAFHDNALLLLCTPFLLVVAGRWAAAGLRGRRWRPVLGARASYAVGAVLVAWAVLRNLR